MRHTLEQPKKGAGSREKGEGKGIVRRHLVASFVYTILDIGDGFGAKGNGHQHEICKAQHALDREKEKKDQLKEIYAGDKFKTHVLHAGGRRRREREREMEYYVEAINCLFIVCYLFVFLSIASRFICHWERPHNKQCAPLSDCVVTTSVTAQVTGNNFISFYAYHLRSLSRKIFLALFLPIPIPSSNYTHTASVSIVLSSRGDQSGQSANRPVTLSDTRTPIPYTCPTPPPPRAVQIPHTHSRMVQWVIRVIPFLAKKKRK